MKPDHARTRSTLIRILFYTQVGILSLLVVTYLVAQSGGRVGSLFFGILLGSLGAAVSLMRRIRRSGNTEMMGEMMYDKVFSILMPVLYGTIMAGICYLLFMSRLLSGEGGGGQLTSNLFPNFREPADGGTLVEQFRAMVPARMKDTGKLLVWCFIAGYSERFVIGILRQLEKKG